MVQKTVRQLKQRALMASAQNKALRDKFGPAPEVLHEIHRFSWGFQTSVISVISSSLKIHLNRRCPLMSTPHQISHLADDAVPSHPYNIAANVQSIAPSAPISVVDPLQPATVPLTGKKKKRFDYLTQLPPSSGNAVAADFDDAIGAIGESKLHTRTTLIEELRLGLGGISHKPFWPVCNKLILYIMANKSN